MTGFIFSPSPENETLRRFGHDLLPSTLGETLSATFDDPQLRPSGLLETQAEIDLEAADETPADERRRLLLEAQGRVQGTKPEVTLFQREQSRLLSVEEAKERFPSLEFKEPVRERVAEILSKQKREEAIRKDIIARGPKGIGTFAAQLGVSLAATAIDPLNVASAFVPVVGQARFAGMVARTGLTRARLAKGVVEGAVGNALIEPVVGSLSKAQQLDYEMSDALINIALGGLLGGGLHVTGGKISDFMSSRSPATREAALRTSVAQAVQGKRIDVTDIVDPRLFSTTSLSTSRFDAPILTRSDAPGAVQASTQTAEQAAVEILVPSTNRAGELRVFETERQAKSAQRRLRQDTEIVDAGDGRFVVANRRSFEPERGPEGEVLRFPNERAAGKFIERIRGGDKDLSVIPFGPSGNRAFAVVRGATEADVRGAFASPELVEIPDVARERFTPRESVETNLQKIAEREDAVDNDITADISAAERVQKTVDSFPGDIDDNAAQIEVLFEREQIDALRASGVLTKAMEKQVDELEDLVSQAESFGKAARAAALCMGRQ